VTLLMDTNVFLWWVIDAPALSSRARDEIANPGNEILLSAASGWEIAIKSALGRLDLPAEPQVFVPEQLHHNNFGVLPVSLHHSLAVYSLPSHHRDPFDRLLIAQAKSEQIPLISGDEALAVYEVEIVW